MIPKMLATLSFPHILQCRIMSPGRQCHLHWYTCTNVSDETSASITRVVKWSRDITSHSTFTCIVTFERIWNLTSNSQVQIHKYTYLQPFSVTLHFCFRRRFLSVDVLHQNVLNFSCVLHSPTVRRFLIQSHW